VKIQTVGFGLRHASVQAFRQFNIGKGMHMSGASVVHILSISPNKADHDVLASIFRNPNWVLHEADGATAQSVLASEEVGVVLTERDLRPNSPTRLDWTDVLQWTRRLVNRPPLIVVCRLADERLWADALHLGAFDVLSKPLNRAELLSSVRLAWTSWRRHRETAVAGKLLQMAG
jgi:DNA-binding response OmpR family regulator